jgi:F-type H+-transporting ATPase subunit b
MLTILAADEPNGVHLPGDINEVYWGSLAFFVLVALLWWKAGPLIKRGMNGRTERIRSELAEAQADRNEAEAALNASTADLPDIGVEADRIRSEAEVTAARLRESMIERAHADAASLQERAVADIETMRRQALADLREEVGRLTRGATEVVVTDSLDGATHADLIENYITQVGQLR